MTARDNPRDAEARAEVAREWMRMGKPKLAISWAREAFQISRSPEHAALLRGVAKLIEEPTVIDPRLTVRRTETWEVMGTSLLGPPVPAKLESQLNALFGGDLFREETRIEPLSVIYGIRPPRRLSSAFGKLCFAAVLVGLSLFALAAQQLKLRSERSLVAHDLAGFLRTGELRQADEALDRARKLAGSAEHDRLMEPLMARAEATLYRYVDSSEERRRNVEVLLSSAGEGTFDAAIARALITPAEQLTDVQAVLQAIAEQTRDPEAAFLLGVSLASAGRRQEADRAFSLALDLEPSNLPHLAEYAVWLTRTRRERETHELLDQMRTIDPESPWIAWVEDQLR